MAGLETILLKPEGRVGEASDSVIVDEPLIKVNLEALC